MDSPIKMLPFEERKQIFIEKLRVLCNELDIDVLPIIGQSPNAIVAQLLFLDLQNTEMMKRFGVAKANPLSSPSADGEKLPN